jgi:hypothetical protein
MVIRIKEPELGATKHLFGIPREFSTPYYHRGSEVLVLWVYGSG